MTRHGLRSRYLFGCRCEDCRKANADFHFAQRQSRKDRLQDAVHGERSTYNNWGCRCHLCREASSLYARQRKTA